MSDEFFFDDDAQDTKKASKSSAKKSDSKGSTKKSSSKQKEASGAKKKSPAKASDAKSPVKPEAKRAEVEESGSFVVRTEEGTALALSLVVLIAIISILVGAIGGIFIGRSLAPQVVYDSTATPSSADAMNSMMGGGTTGTGTGTDATQGMPSGHPDISTMQDASGAGSGTTTNK